MTLATLLANGRRRLAEKRRLLADSFARLVDAVGEDATLPHEDCGFDFRRGDFSDVFLRPPLVHDVEVRISGYHPMWVRFSRSGDEWVRDDFYPDRPSKWQVCIERHAYYAADLALALAIAEKPGRKVDHLDGFGDPFVAHAAADPDETTPLELAELGGEA